MSSGLKMAKASEADIKELSKYLQRLEKKNGATFPFGWRRVVMGCSILIDNCCDPTKDYLDFNPKLGAADDMLEALKEANSTIEWMWKNMSVTSENLVEGQFNIPANALSIIEAAIAKAEGGQNG
jgi:hypothetical protein